MMSSIFIETRTFLIRTCVCVSIIHSCIYIHPYIDTMQGIGSDINGIPYNGAGIRNRHNSGSINNDNASINNTSSLPVYTPLDLQQMEEQSGQAQQMQLIPDQTYLRVLEK